MIFSELTKTYKSRLVKLPELMFLGLKMESIDKKDRVSLRYLITAARIQYARFWKQTNLPKLENWIISWMNIVEMDKIARKLRMQNQQEFMNCKVSENLC